MTGKARILIVDDERSMREMVSILLKRNGFDVATARSGKQAIEMLTRGDNFDLIVTDLVMDRGGGLDVLRAVKEQKLGISVVVFTAFGSPQTAVEAMKLGASDYISKPFNVEEFLIVVNQALAHRALVRENNALRAKIKGEFRFVDIIGRSEAMQRVVALCKKVSDSMATVLITGESGTGKEVVARALHYSSPRADAPFLPINCGALPEQLMESELFGHNKGAFTGAVMDKEGLFAAAKGGTVFLDEIGELPQQLQVKLLRVLQEKMIRPVGASLEVPVDIRVVAATNQDLKQLVANGMFRSDLFYRLNVINIEMPPLRDRREDIPLLADYLLGRIAAEQGAPPKRLNQEAMRRLMQYRFPGNVRELANFLERAATLAAGDDISPADLPNELGESKSGMARQTLSLPDGGIDMDAVLSSFERNLIEQALAKTGGVRNKAAALLGISFRSFRYRLDKLGIAIDDDRKR
jgi:two-component system, NtrC family, response regulator PilR